jgi:hypothetical protein
MAPNDKFLRDISGDELGLLHDLNRTRLWAEGCLITETCCEDCAADSTVEEDKIAIVRAKLLWCTLVIHYPASSPWVMDSNVGETFTSSQPERTRLLALGQEIATALNKDHIFTSLPLISEVPKYASPFSTPSHSLITRFPA